MNWLNILNQIFDVCLIPLLGLATSALIVYIRAKIAQGKEKNNSELADKYLGLLETTIIDCIKATNQTYVNSLKDKQAFDADAQKEALTRTTNAVLTILSDDAKKHITPFVGDIESYIKEKIEANIKEVK
jgi:hypothetical protein